MQVPAPFDYERATSVEHAIGLLARLGGAARLVAGGHSLLPMMKLRLVNVEYLIDINDLHRALGRASFALAPAVGLTALLLSPSDASGPRMRRSCWEPRLH